MDVFFISFGGIVLVQGFDTRVSAFYLFLGVTASLFLGLGQNIIRKLNTSEHPLVLMFYLPLVTTPITGVYCLFVGWKIPTWQEWVFLILVGILTQLVQFFMTKAIQLEELSKISGLQFLSIVSALGFGYFFFDETYQWEAILGMVITVHGVLFNLWYKTRLQIKSKGFKS